MSVVQPATIHELYRQHAALHGNAPAVQGLKAVDLSFSGLMAQIDLIAGTLSVWGIGRSDVVLIQLPNGPEVFVALHGVAACAVALVVDQRAGGAEVEYDLRFTRPKALIVQQGVACSGRDLAQSYGVRLIEIAPMPDAGAGTFAFVDPPPLPVAAPPLNGPDDLAFLIATSGTTAEPKLVPKTQRAMLKTILFPFRTQFRTIHETMPIPCVNYLPMHMIFGSMMASAALASGAPAACMPGFDPEKFFDWLDVYRPIQLIGPPALLEQLLALAPRYGDVLARHSLRYISTGAAALPEATRDALYRVFGVPIVQTYGMTEADIIAQLILPLGAVAPVALAGQVEDVERTRIRAEDGTFLPAGQVGEIVVRPDTFTGYWNNPEATREAFADGWFRTGDVGIMDEAGHLSLLGRVKEVINSGGAKVSPYEVEAILKQHPQVVDVAVFGIPHTEIGETVAAAVVGSVTERELRKFASERLPFYKVPTRIIVIETIPLSASGKVQRNRLAEQLNLK